MEHRPLAPAWPELLTFPEPPVRAFEGFHEKAFALLDALKEAPYIETYQEQKPELEQWVLDPLKVLRDDLVLNWVIPNGLDLETERNVFSRLLKNDFGAGAAHHHIWFSFYRKHLSRLKDIQLAFTLRPAGVVINLFVGGRANSNLVQVRQALLNNPDYWIEAINRLLVQREWTFSWSKGHGKRMKGGKMSEPLQMLPYLFDRADALWLSRLFDKESVLANEGQVLDFLLDGIQQLWPLYRAWILITQPSPGDTMSR